jgi:hypothetical protein
MHIYVKKNIILNFCPMQTILYSIGKSSTFDVITLENAFVYKTILTNYKLIYKIELDQSQILIKYHKSIYIFYTLSL